MEEGLAELAQAFGDFEAKLESQGIPFIMVLCCDKEAVYPEYMPDNINVIGEKSRFETMYDYLKENTDLDIISMQEVLTAHKDEGMTLYNKKYDVSHWNKVGAYWGYYELMKRISAYDEDVVIIEPEQMSFVDKNIDGEILYGAISYSDTIYEYSYTAGASCQVTTDKPTEMQEDNSIFFHWHNDADEVKGKSILIAGDSYIYSFLLPLISESFEELYFVHSSSQYVSKWIEFVNPDYFVYETVERSGISYTVTK